MDQINDGAEGKQAAGYSPEQYHAMAAAIGVSPIPPSADTEVANHSDSDPRLMTHAEREAKVRDAAAAKGLDYRQELFRSRAPKRSTSDNSLGL